MGDGALFAQHGGHGLAQTAQDAVLLADDDGTALFGRFDDQFLVQRLDGAQVDHPGLDALVLQLLGGNEGLIHFQAGGDDGHIAALGELFALADLELEGSFIMEHWQGQATEAQVDGAFVLIGALTAPFASTSSAGQSTVMPGMERIRAKSSQHW